MDSAPLKDHTEGPQSAILSQDLTVYSQHLLLLVPTSAVLLADSVCQLFSLLPPMTLPWAGWRVELFPGTRVSELVAMEPPEPRKWEADQGLGGRTHPAIHPRKRPRSPREDQILSLSPDTTQAHVSCTLGSGTKGQEEQTGLEAAGSSPPSWGSLLCYL